MLLLSCCDHPVAVRRYGFANGAACCAQTCGKCGGTDCEKLPGGEDNCCFHSIADPDGKKSDGSDTHGVPKCRDNNGVGPCVIDESFFVVSLFRCSLFATYCTADALLLVVW